jgi:hypothetical protein
MKIRLALFLAAALSGTASATENDPQTASATTASTVPTRTAEKEGSSAPANPPTGGVAAPIQAAARPFDLAIVDSVRLAASDSAASNFRSNVLPSITQLIDVNLRERVSLRNATAMMLDPSQLRLAADSAVRVYFVGEGAGYHNSLAFNFYAPGDNPSDQAAARPVITPATRLIFPDASSSVSSYDPASKAVRTTQNPLLPGDFVDLGNFKAKGRLDLALIANGAAGGSDVFVASPARNPDRIPHVVTFALKDSPYLIAAFEDLRGGGDRDYNDVIVALDIGRANVERMVSAPVPPAALTLGGLLFVAALWRRRLAAA